MAWVNVIDLFWPVGSIWWTKSASQNPTLLFGGNWNKTSTTINGTVFYYWERTS